MHLLYFVHLCLCLVHCIYLGEEVKTTQAADNAVDLREPSAFTTGLWTTSKKKTDSFKTLVCDKTAHPTATTGLEQQSKATPLFHKDFKGIFMK